MVNFVFPFFPASLPTALAKWSPFKGFTKMKAMKKLNETSHEKTNHLVFDQLVKTSVNSHRSRLEISDLERREIVLSLGQKRISWSAIQLLHS